ERPAGGDRLGLAQSGYPDRDVALRDATGEAVAAGKLELAVAAPDPDRAVRQQGHRMLLARRDRRDPADLGDRRRGCPQAGFATDPELALLVVTPRHRGPVGQQRQRVPEAARD